MALEEDKPKTVKISNRLECTKKVNKIYCNYNLCETMMIKVYAGFI